MLPKSILLSISISIPQATAIAITSPPPSLHQPTSNLSSHLSPFNVVSPAKCAIRSVDYRGNVRAIDCLNLFTFILATEDHTKQRSFILPPGAPSSTTAYLRKAGTCELGVVFAEGATAVVSSLDEILRAALRVVGLCLLDNRSDATHWGGGVVVRDMLIGVAGLTVPALGNEPRINYTSTLDRDFGTWIEGLADS